MSLINTILSIVIQGAIAVGPFAALLLIKRKPRQPYLISIILCLSLIVSHSYYVRGVVGHFIESPFIIAEPFIGSPPFPEYSSISSTISFPDCII